MATPESLKRVIYLQVEVDLRLHVASPHHNHNVNLETNLVLVCNTSYAIKESLLASSVNSSLLSAYRIMWYKDNELIQSHHHHQHHHHHDNAEAHLQTATSNSREVDASNNKVVHVISNNSVLNYKIEYFTRPVLWSKLVIKSLKPANLGTYTCVFRNQSASLLVNLENGNTFDPLFLYRHDFKPDYFARFQQTTTPHGERRCLQLGSSIRCSTLSLFECSILVNFLILKTNLCLFILFIIFPQKYLYSFKQKTTETGADFGSLNLYGQIGQIDPFVHVDESKERFFYFFLLNIRTVNQILYQNKGVFSFLLLNTQTCRDTFRTFERL